ncbi:hypothetical protein LTR91_003595 [Friedmanniomyces endolithicus]|uniref:RNA polymerase II subunit B1 CTD phosphatase RPAP2 homolog n=1 Tax=Friedmanniomyces endolithicus TaxID=329885 RepID=A0AAN6KWR4_9PEZI|nr:hypothetical protein LTS09_015900 [Friedmanniomyces endolithicus]KAK0293352.1 hypothetical protein LTS00_007598 [Friedmanniomyces endolithicus]KAK0979970.1 hypothetical protein LTR54_015482 [Friedmanniomyces endolithicus]KAK1006985.1 hypothetical protein LTR91_003595 [Friedmanniomyces endolithicus]
MAMNPTAPHLLIVEDGLHAHIEPSQSQGMATRVPVKSILKTQPKPASPTPNPEALQAEKDRHNYALALQHAHRIQDQKDWDLRILHAIEALLDYPSSTPVTAQEANNFVGLPSDLDALVEERVIDRKCGYALCANKPRCVTMGREAEWRVGKGEAGFCSKLCTRKSMGVRAQLSVVPAWEREAGYHPVISLHEDDSAVVAGRQSVALGISAVAKSPSTVAAKTKHVDDDDLALERGEKARSFRPRQVMTDRIVEKALPTYKPLSSVSGALVSSTAIEGYEPREHKTKTDGRGDNAESDDDDDEDDRAGALDEDDEG